MRNETRGQITFKLSEKLCYCFKFKRINSKWFIFITLATRYSRDSFYFQLEKLPSLNENRRDTYVHKSQQSINTINGVPVYKCLFSSINW